MRLLTLCILLSFTAAAQNKDYPKGYFRNPLNIPILLAGNFGECRPGHFHSGIDIKTEGKENQTVFAAADGYISRVKMEPGGFGHGIYITHPNGYTTLYAHLNDFFPELQKLVHAAQYEKKNWEVDLAFTADKFPVKQGQQIAWSGNTGGSTAPHLHFEIRDSKTEHPLNPMLFGFKILDNIAPIVSEIALYNAGNSIYEDAPIILKLKKKAGVYAPLKDTVILAANEINIGLAVTDFMNNSENTLSIYTAEWFSNNELQGTLTLDDIGYDETRYLNACADYKSHKLKGIWYNSLFLLPNNKLERIYTNLNNSKGSIHLPDNSYSTIKIILTDAAKNQSIVQLTVKQEGKLPKSTCTSTWVAGTKNSFETPNIRFSADAESLYDNICFISKKTEIYRGVSDRFQLHFPYVPLHKYNDLSLKPKIAIAFSIVGKIALMSTDGKTVSGKAATLRDGWYTATTRSFGDYWLALDTIAPLIKPIVKSGLVLGKKKEIRFKITDNYTSVKKISGTINGQWVCFEQHENNWFYKIDEHCPAGKNKLVLSATDENDNESKMDYIFTR